MRKPSILSNEELLKEIVLRHKSAASVFRELGMSHTGGNHKILHKYIKKFDINVGHFTGACWNKGMKGEYTAPRVSTEDILNNKATISNSKIRRRFIKEGILANKCYKCGILDWLGEPLNFHLHHKDGNNENNARENLENRCPNCHSQTETYGKIKGGSVDQRKSQGT